ncbi:MAG: tRNA lysidine(34) synthetase TilS [Anaeroplasma sp.]
MESKVSLFLKKNNIIIDKPIVCAVSGGVDSVSMLMILHKLGYRCILAHVNHHKRKESKYEQEAMQKLAENLNIPFELLSYYFDGNDNFHNDSHLARYNFFKEICLKYNTNFIATAHHLDDQIETILMNLINGSNLYGYGGISPYFFDGQYKIIRPLLCTFKEEIYQYANENNIIFFEDSSNQEDEFLRNRLRHNIIPLLKKESDNFYNKIAQYSEQLKQAFSYIRKQSIDYLNLSNNIIDINTFNNLDIAIKKDIISLLFERNNIRRSFNLINDIISLLASKNGEKIIRIEDNWLFVREYSKAYIKKETSLKKESLFLNFDNEVVFAERYKFYFSKSKPIINAKYIKLCYNTIRFPIIIRNRQNGDSIEILIGNKKINRIFIDLKISKQKRDYIPIITDADNKILWVYDLVKSKDVYTQKNKGDIYLVCEEL